MTENVDFSRKNGSFYLTFGLKKDISMYRRFIKFASKNFVKYRRSSQ